MLLLWVLYKLDVLLGGMSIEELLECGRNWGILYVGGLVFYLFVTWDSIFQKVRLRVPFPDHVCLQTETPGQEVRQQRQDRQDQGQQRRKGSMTSLLLWKEHLKRFYNRYSYGIQPVVRFLFALCTMVSLNTNIGYMAKLKSPLVILPVCLVSAFLPYGAIVFLAGCLMIAHVYAVSLEMA